METKVCPVTGKEFKVGVLLDRRLKDSLEEETVTGFQLSPEVQKIVDEGYIALVEIDESKSTKTNDGNILPPGAYRTGVIICMKRDIFDSTIKVEVPKESPFVYIDSDASEYIKKIQQSVESSEDKE